jgi:hypothetical protein
MATDIDSDHWIPLVEFSVQKGISLSTLRRYIKSNKIAWKLLEGRYLVMDDGSFVAPRNHAGHLIDGNGVDASSGDLESRMKNLEVTLMAANEEIAELKTLLAFYEEKWAQLPKK